MALGEGALPVFHCAELGLLVPSRIHRDIRIQGNLLGKDAWMPRLRGEWLAGRSLPRRSYAGAACNFRLGSFGKCFRRRHIQALRPAGLPKGASRTLVIGNTEEEDAHFLPFC